MSRTFRLSAKLFGGPSVPSAGIATCFTGDPSRHTLLGPAIPAWPSGSSLSPARWYRGAAPDHWLGHSRPRRPAVGQLREFLAGLIADAARAGEVRDDIAPEELAVTACMRSPPPAPCPPRTPSGGSSPSPWPGSTPGPEPGCD